MSPHPDDDENTFETTPTPPFHPRRRLHDPPLLEDHTAELLEANQELLRIVRRQNMQIQRIQTSVAQQVHHTPIIPLLLAPEYFCSNDMHERTRMASPTFTLRS
jgi:hypothetical protein